MAKTGKKRICFLIGPIGEPDSESRIHADWLLEEIVEPAMAELVDFDVVRADRISQPGMIDAQVIGHLLDADLVIADLSHLNPNAFYELGIRHMAQKPVIHMQLADDEIPFDVSLYRATKFSRARPSDLRKARSELKEAVRAVLAPDYAVDNPVTRARGQLRVEQDASPEGRVLIEQVRGLSRRIDELERKNAGGGRSRHESGTIYVSLNPISETDVSDIRDQIAQDIIKHLPVIGGEVSGDGITFRFDAEMSTRRDVHRLRQILNANPSVRDVTVRFVE